MNATTVMEWPEPLLSGREVARRARVSVNVVVRKSLSGDIRPDFVTSRNYLLFRPETAERVCALLSPKS